MSSQVRDLRVGQNDNAKRIMYLAKEHLLNQPTLEVYSGTNGAPVVARACETLVRLNYVTVTDVRTETNVVEGSRRIKFVMKLSKTSEFQKLYEENKAVREKKQAERTATPAAQN